MSVLTKVWMSGAKEAIQEVIRLLKGIDGDVDFYRISPLPEGLNIISGPFYENPYGEDALYLYWNNIDDVERQIKEAEIIQQILGYPFSVDKVIESVRKIGDDEDLTDRLIDYGYEYVHNMLNTGYVDETIWKLDHWGTMYNIKHAKVDGDTFQFETFDNFPRSAISTLSQKFMDVDFFVKYADKSIGYNCGFSLFSRGSETELKTLIDGSHAAKEFAIELFKEVETNNGTQSNL